MKKKLFISIVVSYCALLLVIWGIELSGYIRLNSAVGREAQNANVGIARRVQQAADEKFRDIEREILGLSLDGKIESLAYYSNLSGSAQVYRAYEIIGELNTRKALNDNIKELFIYYPMAGKVLNSAGMYPAQSFYDYYAARHDWPFEDWERELTTGANMTYHSMSFDTYAFSGQALSVLCAFPLRSPLPSRQSVICASLRLEVLDRLLADLLISGNTVFIYMNENNLNENNPSGLNNRILYSSDTTGQLDYARLVSADKDVLRREGIIVSAAQSGIKPWTYYSIYTGSVDLFSEFSQAINYLSVATVVAMLVGVVMLIFFVRNNFKPINTIINENISYSQRLEELPGEIRAKLLRDLLDGVIPSDEVGEVMRETGVTVGNSVYRLLLIKHDSRPQIGSENERVKKAKDFIDKNFHSQDLCTDMVARQLGISPNYLSAEFKKTYEDSITTYINRKRVEESKVLLLEDKDSVSEVALRVGYTNLMTYLRNFKKFEGGTPSQFKAAMHDERQDRS
jgi:AraC-like DNA-binding protein